MLHLFLNNGNHLYNLLKCSLQYLLMPFSVDADGNIICSPRRFSESALDPEAEDTAHPNIWVKMGSTNRPPSSWVERGLDLDELVKLILGLWRPITGWTGGQLKKLFSGIDKIFEALEEPLARLQAELSEAQPLLEAAVLMPLTEAPPKDILTQIKKGIKALSACQKLLNDANPDPDALLREVQEYQDCIVFFQKQCMLQPMRYTAKTYDHVLCYHCPELVEQLSSEPVVSLAAVSSSCLESLNKHFKTAISRYPGGGHPSDGYNIARDPLAGALKWVFELCASQRTAAYQDIAKGKKL